MITTPDIDDALDQLASADPFARERFARDAVYAAEVHALGRLGRELAEDTMAHERAAILAAEDLDLDRYRRDPGYRHNVEQRARAAAIARLKAEMPAMPSNTKQ
jgi:hypothetical protein